MGEWGEEGVQDDLGFKLEKVGDGQCLIKEAGEVTWGKIRESGLLSYVFLNVDICWIY